MRFVQQTGDPMVTNIISQRITLKVLVIAVKTYQFERVFSFVNRTNKILGELMSQAVR